ncbi:DUF2267 domain-containing protein [Maribius pontilimi]|uniref:DUF2267 domain-containing protein n=1 Tax=Palleronia pontilimi TaxID=1964209 RepID=A0A934MFS1_9RHOB|nr:DUF2267 domain-containing protein [Palleronia pontilimi]MBJ3761719.1 DUF2267 domain-containing protein [Palleronia pontilimi]
MPMPWTYRHASREWAHFLSVARDEMNTPTDNATFTAIEGVLTAFRSRLAPRDVVAFAQVLPSVPRAIFVAGWDIDAAPLPPGTRVDWTRDAQALRRSHNLAPANCVAATAMALRRTVRARDLDPVIVDLPAFATEFWSTPGTDPATLEPGII